VYPIKVSPPNINNRNAKFILDDKFRICFGLGYIKDVTQKDLEIIANNRDFLTTLDKLLEFFLVNSINKSTVFSLIYSGACDSIGESRNAMWNAYAVVKQFEKNSFLLQELIKIESDLTGVNFDLIQEYKNMTAVHTIDDVKNMSDGDYDIILDVTTVTKRKTKKGKDYIMIAADGLNVFAWNIEQVQKDQITGGESIHCLVAKNRDFVQYRKLLGRVNISKLQGMKKYESVMPEANLFTNSPVIDDPRQMALDLFNRLT
jgi:DNA polymerase III alpha subunit